MKKILIICFLLGKSVASFAQYNLVPNPSFEVYDTCPYFPPRIDFATPWFNPLFGSTPDYHNVCDTTPQHLFGVPDNAFGHQYARTGVAYMHIIIAWFPANHAAWNYREYIEVELNDSLKAGVDYCLRWYVSACDSCHYVTNNMGMYFSPVQVLDTTYGNPLPLTPQFENPMTNNLNDRFGWTEISGTYTAVGGEKFIVIGNFHDTTSTVVTYTGWSNPNQNAMDAAEYYIDDVLVTPCDSLTGIEENQNSSSINIFPNPFDDHLTIDSKSEIIEAIYISDLLGNVVFKEKSIRKIRKEMVLPSLSGGIYLLKIITNDSESNFKLMKK